MAYNLHNATFLLCVLNPLMANLEFLKKMLHTLVQHCNLTAAISHYETRHSVYIKAETQHHETSVNFTHAMWNCEANPYDMDKGSWKHGIIGFKVRFTSIQYMWIVWCSLAVLLLVVGPRFDTRIRKATFSFPDRYRTYEMQIGSPKSLH